MITDECIIHHSVSLEDAHENLGDINQLFEEGKVYYVNKNMLA